MIDKRQVLPDEYLVKPELLRIFQQHKTISNYLNNFSQNVKSGIRKMLGKLDHEVLRFVPDNLVVKLEIELCHPAYNLNCTDNIESYNDQAPNMRKIQLQHEDNPA